MLEARGFTRALDAARRTAEDEAEAIAAAWRTMNHRTFFAEANYIGYTSTGAVTAQNELYSGEAGGRLTDDQSGTILGGIPLFPLRTPKATRAAPARPDLQWPPSSMKSGALIPATDWIPSISCSSAREQNITPAGWVRAPIREIMRRREDQVDPSASPDEEVTVMTLRSEWRNSTEGKRARGETRPNGLACTLRIAARNGSPHVRATSFSRQSTCGRVALPSSHLRSTGRSSQRSSPSTR